MHIDLTGIVIIVGNYGSGKTEVSINLAVHRKRDGLNVQVADLDLVNPYFRTRQAREALAHRGIGVVIPPAQYLSADLPILPPQISGLIRNPSELTILDVGGNDVGATVLAALADAMRTKPVRMLQVVNPFRPYTDSVSGCLHIKEGIEAAAKLPVSGLIGNANLIDETTADHIHQGHDFLMSLAQESGLPLEFVTAASALRHEVQADRFACPVLFMERQLVPPWKKPGRFGE